MVSRQIQIIRRALKCITDEAFGIAIGAGGMLLPRVIGGGGLNVNAEGGAKDVVLLNVHVAGLLLGARYS